jgi:hypothetical protein
MHYNLRDGEDYDGRRVLRVDLPAWTQHLATVARAKFKAVSQMPLVGRTESTSDRNRVKTNKIDIPCLAVFYQDAILSLDIR